MEWWIFVIVWLILSSLSFAVIQTIRLSAAQDLADMRLKDSGFWRERRGHLLKRCQELEQELSALKSAPSLEKKLASELTILRGSNAVLNDDKMILTKRIAVLTADNNLKSHEILDLKKKSTLKSESHLTEAMSGLCRFIAANQWMLENNKELRDSLESVREVSNSVESFRTDF